MTSREQAVTQLLQTLVEARDPLAQSGSDVHAGADDRVHRMSPLWHACCPRNCLETRRCRSPYATLERQLQRLRQECPELHWHVAERYLRRHVVTLTVRRTAAGVWWETHDRRKPNGAEPVWHPASRERQAALRAATNGRARESIGEHRCRVGTWNPRVSALKVDLAVSWLARSWPGQIHLPGELQVRIAA